MANKWDGRVIVLDTVNDDVSYNPLNDVKNGGSKYSTLRYKVKKIQVGGGANGNAVRLMTCRTDDLEQNDVINCVLETGDLNKTFDYGEGVWFNGLIPKTLGGSSKLYITLA